MPSSVADYRRYPRLAVDLPAFRRAGRELVSERVVNLSRGGLALASRSLLEPGTPVDLVLNSFDGSVEVPVEGKVVWLRTYSDSAPYLAGVRVGRLDPGAEPAYEDLLVRALSRPSGRRAGPRIEINAEALWLTAGKPGPPRSVTLTNLGLGGALLYGPATPGMGQKGELTFVSPSDGAMQAVPCDVRWARSDSSFDCAGVKFDEGERTRAFVAGALRGFLCSARRGVPERKAKPGGVQVGEFEVGPLIGQGGRCDVYRGKGLTGPLAGQLVALKHLRPEVAAEPGAADAFLTEADLGRLLGLPGMIHVHTAVSVGQEHWAAMELVDGASLGLLLAQYSQTLRRPNRDAVVSIAVELLATLHAVHHAVTASGRSLELVHGNITPSNVLVSRDGDVKLTSSCQERTRMRDLAPEEGGLPYVPPEMVLEGEQIGPLVDVYQCAVLLYEALTGVVPFKGETPGELSEAIRRGAVPPSRLNPEIPASLDAAVLQALALWPARRPRGAVAFARMLLETGCVPDEAAARDARSRFYWMGELASRAPRL
ncbi:MAG TPA: PilZ domain-containing protein [Myxococcaceae bacterium]|nr:PilZ domain-containing protein [Myxococcaceae bacterium]